MVFVKLTRESFLVLPPPPTKMPMSTKQNAKTLSAGEAILPRCYVINDP